MAKPKVLNRPWLSLVQKISSANQLSLLYLNNSGIYVSPRRSSKPEVNGSGYWIDKLRDGRENDDVIRST